MSVLTPINNSSLPPKTLPQKCEGDNRRLWSIYKCKGVNYEIECKSSTCGSICIFINDNFGEARFNKRTEKLIISTKPISFEYLMHMSIIIKTWKKNFPNI